MILLSLPSDGHLITVTDHYQSFGLDKIEKFHISLSQSQGHFLIKAIEFSFEYISKCP